MTKIRREPAITAGAILILINAVMVLSNVMGWTALTVEQMAAINAVAAAAASVIVRQNVSPVDKAGNILTAPESAGAGDE